jgi:hypothetical protein
VLGRLWALASAGSPAGPGAQGRTWHEVCKHGLGTADRSPGVTTLATLAALTLLFIGDTDRSLTHPRDPGI